MTTILPAPPTPANAPRPPTTRPLVLHGDHILARATHIDRLATELGHRLRGNVPWLIGLSEPHEAHLVVVPSDHERGVDAALPLVVDRETRTVRTPGAALGHYGVVVSRDDHATAALAETFHDWVTSSLPEYGVSLGPLLADQVAAEFERRTRGWLTALTSDPVPLLARGEHADAGSYFSAGTRRTLRKAANRLAADGRLAELVTVRETHEALALLPALADVHRDRDHDRGLTSLLDSATTRRKWHAWLARLAGCHGLEVTVLRVDAALAAYVVAVVDPPHYRVLEGVFAPQHARYAPGRLLEAAVWQRVLDDPSLHFIDWMTSLAPDSLIAHNAAIPTRTLVG